MPEPEKRKRKRWNGSLPTWEWRSQIQDDILDLVSTAEVLGKPVLSDEKNEKTTYVTLKGLEKAKAEVKTLSDRAADALNSLPGDKEFLGTLIKTLVDREK